jgi:hypothetical protein
MWSNTTPDKQRLFLADEAGNVTGVLISIRKYEAMLRKLNRFKELRRVEKAKRTILRKVTARQAISQQS